MTPTLSEATLENALREMRALKELADKALAQSDDAAFFGCLGPGTNSIAVIVKHLAGNMRSRWTDFLTSDGEKPDRDRDREFVLDPADTRAALQDRWEAAWDLVFTAMGALGPEELAATVYIRGEPHSVIQAIHRQMTHYAYHVGQIALLAKHAQGDRWRTLSIVRGGSEAFNARVRAWHPDAPPASLAE
jgi:hypothetical protein